MGIKQVVREAKQLLLGILKWHKLKGMERQLPNLSSHQSYKLEQSHKSTK